MRRHLLVASIGAIALTGSAFAADSLRPAPPDLHLDGVYLGVKLDCLGSGNLNYTGLTV